MMDWPLISCICPTQDRRDFLEHAIAFFQAQDYPNKELIIIEDGTAPNADLAYGQSGVRYHHNEFHDSIGKKRNIACTLARGEIIALWDDDDYYGTSRLSRQVFPILAGKAAMSGLYMSLLLRMRDMTLWTPSEQVHAALFGYGVRCGTLMFRRYLWEEAHFPDTSKGEDAAFALAVMQSGYRIAQVKDPESYICVRHGANVSDEPDGIEPPEWEQVPLEQYLSSGELAFYRGLSEVEV